MDAHRDEAKVCGARRWEAREKTNGRYEARTGPLLVEEKKSKHSMGIREEKAQRQRTFL